MQRDILLIGGSNIDFIANPFNKIIRKVSNIGKINVSFGGVMRNTTENLARLGNKCTFLTALGNDILGSKLRENLLSLGVTVYSPTTTENSSLYIALNDVNKDLDTGICDNSVINSLDSSRSGELSISGTSLPVLSYPFSLLHNLWYALNHFMEIRYWISSSF